MNTITSCGSVEHRTSLQGWPTSFRLTHNACNFLSLYVAPWLKYGYREAAPDATPARISKGRPVNWSRSNECKRSRPERPAELVHRRFDGRLRRSYGS